VGQRAFTLQRLDLGVEHFVVHGDLAHLGFQSGDFILAVVALAFSGFVFANVVQAQTYPDHPVKIIVPFPAGGTADAVPRIVAAARKTCEFG